MADGLDNDDTDFDGSGAELQLRLALKGLCEGQLALYQRAPPEGLQLAA